MYISKIDIKNYRGIKSDTLYFTKFNTFVGKNDCGKSTVINAIKLFFNDEKVSQKDFNYYQEEDKDIEITVTLSDYNSINLKSYLIKGEKEDGFEDIIQDYISDGNFVIKKAWNFTDNKEVSSKIEILVNNFQNYKIYSANSTDINKWIRNLDVEIPVDGDGNNSDLEKKAYIRRKLIEQGEEQTKEFIMVKHNDIKDSLPTVELLKADQSIETTTTEFKGTFSTEVKSIIKREKEKGTTSTLSDIETQISTKIREEGEIIKTSMQEHISDLSELFITPNFTWEKGVEITNVEIQLKGDQKPIPLENKGSGYRRLFMVGRLRYLAEKKESENVIYLVEEPETFLHPSAQDEMLHSLLSLSDLNQIFISTHSPIFTAATKQNAITLCKKENSELIYDQENSEDLLLEIAKQLGVKPTHNILDTYEIIVFVEGSNDRAFLKIASEKLGKDIHRNEERGKIAIIEGGGGSLGNFIDIQYFEKQRKKMYLIIDSDNYDDTQITNTDTKRDLDKKIRENQELKTRFESKENAKCFILNKKNIDTYYHPAAIKRINNNFPEMEIFSNNFCYETFVKVNRYDQDSNPTGIQGNLPKKNWLDVFNEMTEEEWKSVSNNELENIFDEITSSLS